MQRRGDERPGLDRLKSELVRRFLDVDHDVPNWLPCPDGTFAPGHQKFMFWGIDPADRTSDVTNITSSPAAT